MFPFEQHYFSPISVSLYLLFITLMIHTPLCEMVSMTLDVVLHLLFNLMINEDSD